MRENELTLIKLTWAGAWSRTEKNAQIIRLSFLSVGCRSKVQINLQGLLRLLIKRQGTEP